MDYFNDKNNVYYGHGTGTNDINILNSINTNGLRFSHEQLSFTTVPFGKGNATMLKNIGEKGQSWEHMNSKYIVLASIPQEYEILDNVGTPSYGKKDYAVSYEITEKEAQEKNIAPGRYLRPEFVLGYYDANTNSININPRYYKNLPKEQQEILFQEIKKNYEELVQSTWGIDNYKEVIKDINSGIENETDKIKSPLLNNAQKWNANYKNMSEPELFNLIINNIYRVPKTNPNPVALNDYIAIEFMTEEYLKKYSSPQNISKFINSMKSLDRNTTNKKMFECVGNMIKEEIRKHKKDNTKINSIDDIENIIKNTTKPLDRNGKEYKDLVANIRSYIINNKDNLNFDKVYIQIRRIEMTMENLELIVDTMTVINEQKEKLKKQEKTDVKETIRKEDNSNFIKKTKQYLIDLKEIKNFSPDNLEDILFRLKRIKKEFDELDKQTLRNNYDLYEEVENYIRKTNNKLEEITTLNRKMGF